MASFGLAGQEHFKWRAPFCYLARESFVLPLLWVPAHPPGFHFTFRRCLLRPEESSFLRQRTCETRWISSCWDSWLVADCDHLLVKFESIFGADVRICFNPKRPEWCQTLFQIFAVAGCDSILRFWAASDWLWRVCCLSQVVVKDVVSQCWKWTKVLLKDCPILDACFQWWSALLLIGCEGRNSVITWTSAVASFTYQNGCERTLPRNSAWNF